MSAFDWKSVPVRPPPTAAADTGRVASGVDAAATRSGGSFAAALAAVRRGGRDGGAAESRSEGRTREGRGDEDGTKAAASRGRPASIEAGRKPADGVPAHGRPLDEELDELGSSLEPSPGTLPRPGGIPPESGPVTVSGAAAEASMVRETSAGEVSATEGGDAMEDRMASETAAPVEHEATESAPVGTVVEATPFAPASNVSLEPTRAGDTAPALAATAVGRLMDELRALELPASGQWRFAMRGGPLGIDSIVLSRGEGGAWNLRLGSERARSGGSRADVETLRGALRARGHDVGEIVLADDDDGSAG